LEENHDQLKQESRYLVEVLNSDLSNTEQFCGGEQEIISEYNETSMRRKLSRRRRKKIDEERRRKR
jgi:hypothetical protein